MMTLPAALALLRAALPADPDLDGPIGVDSAACVMNPFRGQWDVLELDYSGMLLAEPEPVYRIKHPEAGE
jgi:hypothetical protein